jgi:uncharacterized membrane protein
MMKRADDAVIDRLETQLGRLLRAGVTVATACLASGLALWLATGGASRYAAWLLTAGLIVLMTTPLARVAASVVAYVKLRDWFFATTTFLVFVVLVAAWLVKS